MKPHQFLGYRYGRIGIVAIPVRTYFIGKSLAYRSAAYHHFYLMTETQIVPAKSFFVRAAKRPAAMTIAQSLDRKSTRLNSSHRT